MPLQFPFNNLPSVLKQATCAHLSFWAKSFLRQATKRRDWLCGWNVTATCHKILDISVVLDDANFRIDCISAEDRISILWCIDDTADDVVHFTLLQPSLGRPVRWQLTATPSQLLKLLNAFFHRLRPASLSFRADSSTDGPDVASASTIGWRRRVELMGFPSCFHLLRQPCITITKRTTRHHSWLLQVDRLQSDVAIVLLRGMEEDPFMGEDYHVRERRINAAFDQLSSMRFLYFIRSRSLASLFKNADARTVLRRALRYPPTNGKTRTIFIEFLMAADRSEEDMQQFLTRCILGKLWDDRDGPCSISVEKKPHIGEPGEYVACCQFFQDSAATGGQFWRCPDEVRRCRDAISEHCYNSAWQQVLEADTP